MSSVSTQQPVFVFGMNGSGTTMMLDCLNSHPELYGFIRETLVIPYYIARTEKLGEALNDGSAFKDLWDGFRNESIFRWVNDGETPPLPDNWRALPRTAATFIDCTFQYFAAAEGKKRWCEKTPMHCQHVSALAEVFPQAQFIHMIRDGRACAASFHRRWGYIPERTIYRWKNIVHQAGQQAKDSHASYLEVKYEALTAEPEAQMRRVCEFLGIPFNDAVLSPSRTRKFTGSTADTIQNVAPKWRSYFNSAKLTKLERIAGKTLAEFDYPTDQPFSDADPKTWQLKLWMARDYVRRAYQVFRAELRRPKNEKWDDLSGMILRAIKQRLSSRF